MCWLPFWMFPSSLYGKSYTIQICAIRRHLHTQLLSLLIRFHSNKVHLSLSIQQIFLLLLAQKKCWGLMRIFSFHLKHKFKMCIKIGGWKALPFASPPLCPRYCIYSTETIENTADCSPGGQKWRPLETLTLTPIGSYRPLVPMVKAKCRTMKMKYMCY